MQPIHTFALAAAIASAPFAAGVCAPGDGNRTAPRYFELVNASHDSATSIAIAPAGEETFRVIAFDGPLRGGTTSTTVQLPAGGCLRDLRITFGDGRVLLYPAIDTCRHSRLQLTHRDGKGPRRMPDRPVAATP